MEQRFTFVVGQRLQFLRLSHDATQDDVAASARLAGLSWQRSTVSAVESSNRGLSAEELILLPWIMSKALGDDIGLADLIPDHTDDLLVTFGTERPKIEIAAEMLRAFLAGELSARESFTHYVPRSRGRTYGSTEAQLARRDADLEAEQRAARKFGVPAWKVALAAHRTWGMSLTARRDEIVESDTTSSSLRARRGHATRKLLVELEPRLKELTGSAIGDEATVDDSSQPPDTMTDTERED